MIAGVFISKFKINQLQFHGYGNEKHSHFFCFIIYGINTQNRIGSDYTPGDAMPLQKPIPGDANSKSDDKERTSAKLDEDDKREDKKRTSAKVDADHPKHKNPVKGNNNPKTGDKDDITAKKDANHPKRKTTVKRKSSPKKEDKG